jgi:hypothetical protein
MSVVCEYVNCVVYCGASVYLIVVVGSVVLIVVCRSASAILVAVDSLCNWKKKEKKEKKGADRKVLTQNLV